MELNDREKGIIYESLILVAKSPNVATSQMKELIELSDKFVVSQSPVVKEKK